MSVMPTRYGSPVGTDRESKDRRARGINAELIAATIRQHNEACPGPVVAVEMCFFEKERLGLDEVSGVPIRVNPDMQTFRFRIVCGLDEVVEEQQSVEAVAVPA